MDFKALIAGLIYDALEDKTGIEVSAIGQALEIPPDTEMGDYAYPCFRLAKSLRKSPMVIAQTLSESIKGFPGRIENVKGYLNFFIDRALYAGEVVKAVLAENEVYGGGKDGEGKTVCLDYSSINIAKRFHIGHVPSTVIGNALKNIYAFLGYNTVSINHLGDWGTQFGKMIAAYKMWGDKEDVEKRGVDAMVELYVRFDREAHEDESLNDIGRAWFKKIEEGDEEAMSIFNWFKSVTLRDAEKTYEKLNVHFDSYAGESFYNDKMDRVIDELNAKNLLVKDQGASIVQLEEYGMPPCLILKSDGATLYHTRDLAAALYRKDTYNFDKCLYVVAYQQDLHFRQLFKVLELMGHEWADKMEHVAFGMVSYEGQTLSTRKGIIVYLEDLLNTAVEKSLEIINQKNPDLENKEEVARQVGIGAIIYFFLFNNRIKDVDFSWERTLSFEGETGPYCQYTYARASSVLRKAGEQTAEPEYSALADAESQDLVRLLEQFPEVVREAADRCEPSMITRYCAELSKAFNRFYYDVRVLDDDPAVRNARVRLVAAARQTLGNGLHLIGIETPERM